jgi:hypothetical protein
MFSHATIQLVKKAEALQSLTLGGCREAYKEWNVICASHELKLEQLPGVGHGVMGGKHVGFNNKQKHEWVILFM